MARPVQQIKIYAIQTRHGTGRVKLPHIIRYTIDGRHRSKSFRTHAEADRYRSELMRSRPSWPAVRRRHRGTGVVAIAVERTWCP